MKLTTFLSIVLTVFVILTVTFAVAYRNCKRNCTYDPLKDQLTKKELEALRDSKDSLQNLYDDAIEYSNRLKYNQDKSKQKQKRNKDGFKKDIADWRALPDSAMQQRADFFRNELSTVDSIAKW